MSTGQPLNNGLRDWYTGQYRHPGVSQASSAYGDVYGTAY